MPRRGAVLRRGLFRVHTHGMLEGIFTRKYFPMDTHTHDKKDSSAAPASDRYMTPIAVIVGAVIIGLALYFGHSASSPSSAGNTGGSAAPAQQQAVNIKDVKTAGDPFIGNPNAPVTMAEWFDYQCPFCKKLDEETLTKLYPAYVQTGKLKIVFKDFPFIGPDSDTAALFARAVWATYPDKFYSWYRAMFNAQDGENTGFGDLASIEKLTKTIPGIDVAKVVATMNKNKSAYEAAISADRAEGQSFGINGTPSMIIGTHLIQGAQPYSVIKAAIDAQLAAQGK